LCESKGIGDTDYIPLLKQQIEELRRMFVKWVDSLTGQKMLRIHGASGAITAGNDYFYSSGIKQKGLKNIQPLFIFFFIYFLLQM
jgi:hypothetical protein